MGHDIVMLAVDDCVGLSIYGPIDLFHTANVLKHHESGPYSPSKQDALPLRAFQHTDPEPGQDALFRTRIVSPDGQPVRASGGHVIQVEGPLQDVHNPAALLLPGISMGNPSALLHRIKQLQKLAASLPQYLGPHSILAAACTGTLLAAQSGLLRQKNATTTWWIEHLFRQQFPDIQLQPDEILVDTGQVITSAAGASSLDLTLHLIDRLAGPHLARLCARFMVIDNARQSQRPYVVPWHEKARDPLLEKADAWIRQPQNHDGKVEQLAQALGMSSRTLLRRFKQLTGDTPQQYMQSIKMERVRHKLESSQDSLAAIASEFGFSDENALRRAFTSQVGLSPSQYRKQFQIRRPP